ncbi:glutamate 5-kinase [Lacihabitans sp. LS3-19]|uniref:glutamate 5-kinase n=1 Tax=Lacihabitans sp. LS3-19 TaxID=2487335 RepID=UPI0020CD3144|nr:glutamate 5-kinase [Lacihabitans sp. LS3-19]MCP9769142.1 glutamate 5-kinase [Lacihabitans sp. LS3-19]
MKRPLLVLKFGTASITKPSGEPDLAIIEEIARQVASLHNTYRIVIVSSGAVGAGKHFVQNYEGTISQKKAAAAIGNPLLLKMYDQAFEKFGIKVAQSLLERQHFANRQQFLQLKETYEELWKSNIIPIANENDVVSNRELKFSDNDELATLIAGGFGASNLMLCTASGGLLNKNGELVSTVMEIDEQILGMVSKSKTALGLGGMASKLTFTHLATKMGIQVMIFGMKVEDGIINALNQKSGTTFLSQKVKLSAKDKWIASGGLTVGRISIDDGASKALLNRKSLLAVGISHFEGEFEAGELVEIINENAQVLAIGQAKLSSVDLASSLKIQNLVFVHADDLVLI